MKSLTTRLEDLPISTPRHYEVRIKVSVAASSPKDWKHPHPDYFSIAVNQGDYCAGIVNAVGSDVRNFNPGDRVAGFHVMDTEHGTYAEYAIRPENTVFHLPEHVSDEEGATIPLAAFTAAVGLYRNSETTHAFREERRLEFPNAKGAAHCEWGGIRGRRFCDKARQRLNPDISPIIGTAGESQEFAKGVGADVVVD
ncbi:hypothetical protein LTR28_011026 [Elasticomyces elasticus]|nr:hypothetical protein LTR28_011026 [Elasticomyces elasticus]